MRTKEVKSEDTPTYKVGKSDEDSIIAQAMSILEERMKKTDITLGSPEAVRQYLKLKLGTKENEVFCVLYLNTQHQLISMEEVFQGTIDSCSVHPRVVVQEALRVNAGAIMLAHNHPSGISEPSAADRHITDRLRDALNLIEIRVLDHFVVGTTIVSFAERGWL